MHTFFVILRSLCSLTRLTTDTTFRSLFYAAASDACLGQLEKQRGKVVQPRQHRLLEM